MQSAAYRGLRGASRIPVTLLAAIARVRRILARIAHGHTLRVGTRFVVVLVALVLCLVGVGWAALAALSSTHHSLNRIYSDNVVTTRLISNVGTRLDDAEETILYGVLAVTPAQQRRVTKQIATDILPAIEVQVAEMRRLVSDNPQQARLAAAMSEDWHEFTSLYARGGLGGGALRVRERRAERLAAFLDAASEDQTLLFSTEGTEARDRAAAAAQDYNGNVWLMVAIVIAGVLASVLIVLWLIHTMLPRLRAYSRFAQRMAGGDYSLRLKPNGGDEIAQLGRILDQVAQSREDGERYDRTQVEFSDALQQTDGERPAQDLLRRHLERSIRGATVTVLNRNNSADRLESVSAVPSDSPLYETLRDASPHSCLAVRSAAIHVQVPDEHPLVPCEVCSGCPGISTCVPLLVGGEVIGAVLTSHPDPLLEEEARRLRESVRQAAPVVANLRNLTISQMRAATDALTGLPNRRELDFTLKRMVAQASRTGLPLAALMVDIDHFKQVNDQLGHSKGDEILAAVGALLGATLRASDFAARYGGEEFLVLAPATDTAGALALAEKIRDALHRPLTMRIDRAVTASIGVAVVPDHALDAEGLVRAADRALYSAKTNGRDRTETASRHSAPRPEEPTDLDALISG